MALLMLTGARIGAVASLRLKHIDLERRHVFQVSGLSRQPLASTGPLNEIVKGAFAAVQLPRYTPHSFRYILVLHGDKICQTREAFKAWSQNMGHKSVLVSVSSYMPVTEDTQREIILIAHFPDRRTHQARRDFETADIRQLGVFVKNLFVRGTWQFNP